MKTSLPAVSVIIVTRNEERKLPKALESIAMQNYPRSLLEVIVVDGGSTDQTFHILKNSPLKPTVIMGKYPNNMEARRAIGAKHAKGEILAYIDSDNYMPHKMWLQSMVLPFTEVPGIVGAYTLRYAYRKNDTLLNRYFALLGSADPVDYFLGKGERLSYAYDTYNRAGKVVKKTKYYRIVEFSMDTFPTLGANGFLANKQLWMKNKLGIKRSVHVDVPYDLARRGYATYAIVDDAIIHDTADSLWKFLRKRIQYILYYQTVAKNRIYKIFDPQKPRDLFALGIFIASSLTLVYPTAFAVRGFIKKRDIAWFMHPFYCFTITCTYSGALTFRYVRKLFSSFSSKKR